MLKPCALVDRSSTASFARNGTRTDSPFCKPGRSMPPPAEAAQQADFVWMGHLESGVGRRERGDKLASGLSRSISFPSVYYQECADVTRPGEFFAECTQPSSQQQVVSLDVCEWRELGATDAGVERSDGSSCKRHSTRYQAWGTAGTGSCRSAATSASGRSCAMVFQNATPDRAVCRLGPFGGACLPKLQHSMLA